MTKGMGQSSSGAQPSMYSFGGSWCRTGLGAVIKFDQTPFTKNDVVEAKSSDFSHQVLASEFLHFCFVPVIVQFQSFDIMGISSGREDIQLERCPHLVIKVDTPKGMSGSPVSA